MTGALVFCTWVENVVESSILLVYQSLKKNFVHWTLTINYGIDHGTSVYCILSGLTTN